MPELETKSKYGKELPVPLVDLYEDNLFGLVSIDVDKEEGVILYDRCTRVDGRPAIEIPHSNPYLVDESTYDNNVSPPPKTFEQLVDEYGCKTYSHPKGFTYIVVDNAEH